MENRSITCTAPWTTLEVTDLAGLVHQCEKSWTIGDRGSLASASLVDVWNGEGYRSARRVMGAHVLDALCQPVCPCRRDGRFSEGSFRIVEGSPAFVENQRLMAEDIAARREIVRCLPVHMSLCPSTYCNYDCIMCDYGRTPRRDLPDTIWAELPGFLPTLRELTLHGGEPLASHEVVRFLRDLDPARYPDLRVNLITNGSLLTEGLLRHLGRCAFGEVTVSLNAGTAEVYQAVQRGAPFDAVLTAVDALVRFRDAHPRRFNIALGFVVQPENAHTLVAFAELAVLRGLPIRLRPLASATPDGLAAKFYGDPDAVAAVLSHLDRLRAFVAVAQPAWAPQVDVMCRAISAQAQGGVRARGAAQHRLPLVS
jgi:pyruvate-formate lyase-activating enzyme